jgi:serine protease DegQ
MLRQLMQKRNLLILLVLVGASASAQLPFLSSDEKPSLAPLLKMVTPAVVNISSTAQVPVARNPLFDDPFFDRFFRMPDQPQSVPRRSAGSGVIIDAERGYVVTNNHVIENADEITVTLADRRRFTAKLIGTDKGPDIALLQIDADRLTALEIGNADELEVGDFVIAIGNPFGLGQTVTSGIVSALGRSGLNIEGYEDFIQTDASINPGNSGGALIDLDGKLVGINTAIVSPGGGGNVGIGFAVPMSMAQEVVAQLLEFGEVQRGRLGIYIQDVTPELAEALGLDVEQGAVVTQVEPGSAAEQAGIMAGDVVTELNGMAVEGSSDLRNRVGLVRIGAEVDLTYVRDGRVRHATAVIKGGQGTTLTPSGGETIDRLDGAEFSNLGSDNPHYGDVEGVVVSRVAQGSRAEQNGLQSGDIITAVNRTPVTNVQELALAIANAPGAIALNILRDDARLFIVIQ